MKNKGICVFEVVRLQVKKVLGKFAFNEDLPDPVCRPCVKRLSDRELLNMCVMNAKVSKLVSKNHNRVKKQVGREKVRLNLRNNCRADLDALAPE